ncbi:YbhB/YbcL family Raf kinase inhibitor-like protein [Rhodanobacter sp. 7MK24]|uniref:YbhB/YbcL family Raf kinase inhibitor-like protein n=1 Tax=Rhodanobacter sp. 7MK24 TaxID=2775922 RepID=UPI00177F4F66|nr:YbhB/YbcL family Raf kinase inhibitor-like protein [Rhodanobacter sp. 7MK24]MBD8880896.1 YbhB/YbcL family Raf kinase inhibitor-like protein [Rhodanobacter sp. 7MK24]
MRRLIATLFASAFALGAHAADFRVQVDGEHGHLPQSSSFHGFGCTGGNRAPAVHWQHAPAGTRSYALTVYDPDAPTGSGWWHWVVINLPASNTALPAGGDLPTGALAVRNDYGQAAWGGPCPPKGDAPHHYIFTVYALDVPSMELPEGASPALAGFMIHGHTLGKAQVTLTYGR